jgi:translation elongation factor P/translation initiation factor 5A
MESRPIWLHCCQCRAVRSIKSKFRSSLQLIDSDQTNLQLIDSDQTNLQLIDSDQTKQSSFVSVDKAEKKLFAH